MDTALRRLAQRTLVRCENLVGALCTAYNIASLTRRRPLIAEVCQSGKDRIRRESSNGKRLATVSFS